MHGDFDKSSMKAWPTTTKRKHTTASFKKVEANCKKDHYFKWSDPLGLLNNKIGRHVGSQPLKMLHSKF